MCRLIFLFPRRKIVGSPTDEDKTKMNAAPLIDFGFSAMMTNRTTAVAHNALTKDTDLAPKMLRDSCLKNPIRLF